MANTRLSMRKIVDVLRLSHAGGLSHREIARVVKNSPTTVGEILRRAKLVGVESVSSLRPEVVVKGFLTAPGG